MNHTVAQGEQLSGIAAKYGFADYRTIWNHANNAALKQKRVNPNVLFPGDVVFIPPKQAKKEERPTGERHRFRARIAKLMVRLTLQDADGRPLANAPCKLTVEGKAIPLTSDGEGRVDAEIPRTAQTASLQIDGQELPVRIGHLDPVEERSGAQARLANLGYYRGPESPVDEMELLSAIEEFQCDNRLPVNGQLDAATLAKLKEAHGC